MLQRTRHVGRKLAFCLLAGLIIFAVTAATGVGRPHHSPAPTTTTAAPTTTTRATSTTRAPYEYVPQPAGADAASRAGAWLGGQLRHLWDAVTEPDSPTPPTTTTGR
jgi:hypothetical protein